MKKIYQENKAFFTFLILFFTVYGLLSLLYKVYLNSYTGVKIDFFTQLVSDQATWIIRILDYPASVFPSDREAGTRIFIENKAIGRVIEGCNAIAVMNLFTAFVIAFKGKLKTTFLFISFGLISIHILNIIRVALIIIAFYLYPEYQKVLHDIFFPLIIYGFVFLLWILWIKKYSNHAKNISK